MPAMMTHTPADPIGTAVRVDYATAERWFRAGGGILAADASEWCPDTRDVYPLTNVLSRSTGWSWSDVDAAVVAWGGPAAHVFYIVREGDAR